MSVTTSRARYQNEPATVAEELPRLRDELGACNPTSTSMPNPNAARLRSVQRFLREQLDDLTEARETLLDSIREIERETQTQFNETFARVSESFP